LVGLREFVGDGLFTADDHEPNWGLAHDLLMPAFTKAAMQRYRSSSCAERIGRHAVINGNRAGADLRRRGAAPLILNILQHNMLTNTGYQTV
jgi:unspecific monooxygenase